MPAVNPEKGDWAERLCVSPRHCAFSPFVCHPKNFAAKDSFFNLTETNQFPARIFHGRQFGCSWWEMNFRVKPISFS